MNSNPNFFDIKVVEVKTPYPGSTPEIIYLSYDLVSLKITLKLDNFDNEVFVVFNDIVGFRVLDEGDLTEYWNEKVRVLGWIWKIESGGWFELEKLRDSFISQYRTKHLNEYLVSGIDDCVSVLTYAEPIIVGF